MLKDVGILPHGKRVYDETQWIKDTEPTNSSRFDTTTYIFSSFEGDSEPFVPIAKLEK